MAESTECWSPSHRKEPELRTGSEVTAAVELRTGSEVTAALHLAWAGHDNAQLTRSLAGTCCFVSISNIPIHFYVF